ncbi:pyridoxamine 5'-phosphate oxidase [Cryptosporangium phraense]|uniref:Pyridoxine/pyridoxamine 5'-phosphate oxidase n=1 Tax=Cryptosporangium phraense TaxID=2593070 RepID=A0A545APS3_9ACTN|nr:pyridoxamine 5'-phosphate oxidase [Cryptosporangium phraense]
MRVGYDRAALSEESLADTWFAQFSLWFAEAAVASEIVEPNAMIVATAAANGTPSARTVLLKDATEHGLEFFTHYTSRKGRELTENPRATLLFPWHPLQRQVNVAGIVHRVDEAESDAYWRTRPRGSQLGSAASPQSRVVPNRAALENAEAALAAEHPDDVPRPATWGGFRVVPYTVEFWQGRPDRLHDRLRYRRDGETWVVERLGP